MVLIKTERGSGDVKDTAGRTGGLILGECCRVWTCVEGALGANGHEDIGDTKQRKAGEQ